MNENNDGILVSIIVPVYNTEKYLDKCIYSLINQTYKNIEIILIDDGSIDNSLNICNDWSKKDSRIKVHHKENSGVSSTRNIGLKFAKGEYISFVDGDDFVKENYIEVLLNCIIKNNCDISIINYVEIFSNNIEKENIFYTTSKLIDRYEFLEHIYDKGSYNGAVWNKMYSKKIIDENKLHFFEDVHYGEDLFFTIQFANNAQRFYYEYDEHLYYYNRRNESITNSKFNYKIGSFTKIAENLIEIYEKNGVDSSRIKKQYMYFNFLVMTNLNNNDLTKEEYKKIYSKYSVDVLKSSKIEYKEKLKIIGIRYFPEIMKKLRDIKINRLEK